MVFLYRFANQPVCSQVSFVEMVWLLTSNINQNEYCIASWDSYVNLYERTKQNKTNLQTSKQTNKQTKKGGNRFWNDKVLNPKQKRKTKFNYTLKSVNAAIQIKLSSRNISGSWSFSKRSTGYKATLSIFIVSECRRNEANPLKYYRYSRLWF